jgi:hypothetical protein
MTVRIDLVDVVRELTDTTSHREEYAVHRGNVDGSTTLVEQGHVTVRPSLIAQLRVAMTTSSTAESGARGGFGSKPSARLDALDALLRMDQEGVRWIHTLTSRPVGEDLSTEQLVRRVAALGRDNDEVEKDLRAWWLHARIVTGWQTPAFRPNNTCPNCRKRGGLRVRVDREANSVVTHGLCVECKAQWTGEDGSFDQLAWHIRVENSDFESADARAGSG